VQIRPQCFQLSRSKTDTHTHRHTNQRGWKHIPSLLRDNKYDKLVSVKTDMPHTHTNLIYDHFLGEPGLAGCPFDFLPTVPTKEPLARIFIGSITFQSLNSQHESTERNEALTPFSETRPVASSILIHNPRDRDAELSLCWLSNICVCVCVTVCAMSSFFNEGSESMTSNITLHVNKYTLWFKKTGLLLRLQTAAHNMTQYQ